MLLFIIGGNNIDLLISSFQYISCYSLSILVSAHMGARTGFQYISCYSLSKYCIQKLLQTEVSIHLMLLFICRLASAFSRQSMRFNTSHVTLYPLPLLRTSFCTMCFNTSHVTLYHSSSPGFIWLQQSFNTSHVTLYRRSVHWLN